MISPSKGRPTIWRGANTGETLFGRPGRRRAPERICQRPKPCACLFSSDARDALRARYHSCCRRDGSGKVIAALRIDEIKRRPGNAKRGQAKHVTNARETRSFAEALELKVD